MALERFKAQDLQISTKPDLSPVTDVDRAVEEALRSTLSRVRPRDAVLGEEFGESGHGSRRWVIDPIDGTKNFLRGVPVWAVLIALMEGDEVAVGLVAAPGLQRRWWAAEGAGAWTGRSLSAATRCEVSKVSSLSEAFLSYSSLTGWADRYLLENFLQLTRSVGRTRAFGDFWSYMLVAQGAIDIACEPEVSL
ncbi:MAG: histidinol phosphatase, partial [Actinomycetota bacterium]|nr:histidinol phosphatase [Actinomycetota bacterium]